MIQRYHNEPVGLRVTPEPGDYLKLHDRILPDGSEQTVTYTPENIGQSLPAASRAGYRFDGWYLDRDCIYPFDPATETVTDSMTLYAKWVDAARPEA